MSPSRTYGAAACGLAAGLLTSTLSPYSVHAHGTEARYVEIADWSKPNFTRTFATNRAHIGSLPNRAAMTDIGTTPPPQQSPRARNLLQKVEIEGQRCIFSDIVAFDVDNDFAFDIDEPVTFTITYVPELSSQFVVAWDRNGGTGEAQTEEITPPTTGPKLQTVSFPMDRARLAGQGVQGSDIAIAARNGFALCDIKIERSNTTVRATAQGTFKLTVKDAETGALVPARVGLYDSTGRAPLASDNALMLQRFADDLRMLPVNDRTFWPSTNRQAFYVDSEYEAKVPVGTYELVATRGLEFRAFRGTIDIKANQTNNVTISLERYVNMPAKGWYSGDAHIHLTRDKAADPVIWGMVAAEDVYVGNLLEMGNITGTHFKQPAEWGRASRFERDGHFILSGQEDPRTWFLGHTIHHNLETPIHAPPEEYFLYHKVFDESHAQGGVSGFAHAGWGQRGADPAQMDRGMALLAPFGSVDFIEVLQGGRLTSDGWYRLLNLGLRVSPAAGSDWPYTDFPGVVRNYVKLDGSLNLDRWFESFRAGHTYVTNGPLVEFTINGQPMGSEIRVKKGAKLDIAASAELNPDVDTLDRLELVVLGDVAHTEAAKGEQASLKKSIVAEHSLWIAARAFGARAEPRNTVIGHTAPIYVVVDDEPTWKAEAVPEIVAGARAQLQKLLVEQIDSTNDLEYWETRKTLADEWLNQRPLLKPRVAEADNLYQALLDRLATFTH
jgi:hypothetical protein